MLETFSYFKNKKTVWLNVEFIKNGEIDDRK